MAKIIKRIIQKPEEIEKVREQWLSIERVINAGLRSIDPRYEVSNLRRRKNGSIEFEASVEFDSKHAKRIEHLLALLEDEDLEFTPAMDGSPDPVQAPR